MEENLKLSMKMSPSSPEEKAAMKTIPTKNSLGSYSTWPLLLGLILPIQSVCYATSLKTLASTIGMLPNKSSST